MSLSLQRPDEFLPKAQTYVLDELKNMELQETTQVFYIILTK